MSNIQLQLPDSLLDEARKVASSEKIPLDDYISRLLARDVARRQGIEYLNRRAQGADRNRFREILASAPDVPPIPGDEIE